MNLFPIICYKRVACCRFLRLAGAGLAWLLAACSPEAELGTPGNTGGRTEAPAYVCLNIAPAQRPALRANPTGGENGDGQEAGQTYENDVENLTVFFFRADNGGVNAPANTPVDAVLTFSSLQADDADGYTTGSVPVELANGTYQVLALVNSDETFSADGLTLGDVRDHICRQAWTEGDGGAYSRFVMASADDAAPLVLNNNSADSPATADIRVERLAARVDYQAEGSYVCTDPAYGGATVEITGAALVNNLTAGTYLLKRTAADPSGANPEYLGQETATADGTATNCVIDPWTAAKQTGATVSIDGQQRPVSDLYGLSFNHSFTSPAEWAAALRAGTSLTDVTSGEPWMRIGYTMENTLPADADLREFATGVVFKARFRPAAGSVTGNYTDGQTFFSWNGALYATCEDMMKGFMGADAFDAINSSLEACGTWSAVAKYAATLTAGDPTGYVAWLRTRAAVENPEETLPSDVRDALRWADYMRYECGYVNNPSLFDGTMQLDLGGIVTRNVLIAHNVRTYEDATCYYTCWLRHGGPEGSGAAMEHAIVRNNIYKLSVEGSYSLGDDLPGETPLVVTVYVNDWTLLPAEQLPM